MTGGTASAFAVYGLAGSAYLWLLGAAVAVWLLPSRWRALWPVAVPLLGWAALTALAYPLNAALPGETAIWLLAGVAVLVLAARLARLRPLPRSERGTAMALFAGIATYIAGAVPYVRAGTLSSLVADSDVEHFADLIAALRQFPIGWSVGAQHGLEATPIGLAYHYVHLTLAVLTRADTFSTAVPSHLLMLALAPGAVYIFARETLGASERIAAVAAMLFALSGLPFGVAAFGWGQQTAAIALVPAALAGVRVALAHGGVRAVLSGGVLAGAGFTSLYLATAPLVGGVALVFGAYRAAHRGRLALLLTVMALAGALSHLSAGAFLLARAGTLRADEVSGRSTHVTSFASLPVLLGVAPLDLFRDASAPSGSAIVRWQPPGGARGEMTAAVAVAALVVAGAWKVIWEREARPFLAAFALTLLAFGAYLRVVVPFPYGEFKLLSSIAFVVPCLVAAGAAWVAGRNRPGLVVAGATLTLGAAGMFAAGVHTRALVAHPWGVVLPEHEVDEVRRTVAAIPVGAPVWVSDQLAPQAAVEWRGTPTTHRAGAVLPEGGASYLGLRWRGIVTHLLAFSGRPVFGTVRRHSTELRIPLDPARAEFVLLDASEDPGLFGLSAQDLVHTTPRLRLYRQANRLTLDWSQLAAAGGGDLPGVRVTPEARLVPVGRIAERAVQGTPVTLPRAVLPIGESMPGRRAGYTIPVRRADRPFARDVAPSGAIQLGIFSFDEREVTVRWTGATGSGSRQLALFPGLTWYVTPDITWPTDLRVTVGSGPATSSGPVLVKALLLEAINLRGEALYRSPAGTQAPLLLLRPFGDNLELVAANLSRSALWTPARLRHGTTLWLDGRDASEELALGQTTIRRRLTLTTIPRSSWVWLAVGEPSRPSLHDLPIGMRTIVPVGLVQQAPADPAHPLAFSLPLAGRPGIPPSVADGVAIRSTTGRLYLVERGQVRWVRDPRELQRRGLSPAIVPLPDSDLWRLPVGLPLD